MDIIAIHNRKKKEYFFSTDHCQNNLEDSWVPITYRLPMFCKPRESLPDGWVKTTKQWKLIFANDEVEIPNPDTNYKVLHNSLP